jgi:hypothetical protein
MRLYYLSLHPLVVARDELLPFHDGLLNETTFDCKMHELVNLLCWYFAISDATALHVFPISLFLSLALFVHPFATCFLISCFVIYLGYTYLGLFWYLPKVRTSDHQARPSIHGRHRSGKNAGIFLPYQSYYIYFLHWVGKRLRFHNDEGSYSTPLKMWLCYNEEKYNS